MEGFIASVCKLLQTDFCERLIFLGISTGLHYWVHSKIYGEVLNPDSKKNGEKKKELEGRLGRQIKDTNRFEEEIASNVINPEDIDVEFNAIGGLESIKKRLVELVILPLRRPELFSKGKLLGRQKGVLLYGPPGTGKTMLAKAIAKECGAVFINIKMSTLMTCLYGDSQKLVAAVFSLAYKLSPAIIFIDEADSFLAKRGNSIGIDKYTAILKTEFMSLWDGFSTDKNARVTVLAATNRPSDIDAAFLRRLPQAFEIGLPDNRGRAEILKVIMKDENVENDIDYDYIASLCDSYTGSDLFELCKEAAYLPIRELLENENENNLISSTELRSLSQMDLEYVISTSTNTKVVASEYSNRQDR